jgi:hypothetical protein
LEKIISANVILGENVRRGRENGGSAIKKEER